MALALVLELNEVTLTAMFIFILLDHYTHIFTHIDA